MPYCPLSGSALLGTEGALGAHAMLGSQLSRAGNPQPTWGRGEQGGSSSVHGGVWAQRKLCGGLAYSWFCTYRDQLMMFPITKSTIRSCEGRQEG